MDEKVFWIAIRLRCRCSGTQPGTACCTRRYLTPSQPDGTPSRTAAEQKMAAAFLNGKERFEWLHQRKNGNVFPAEVCLTALTLSGQPMLLATCATSLSASRLRKLCCSKLRCWRRKLKRH